MVYPTNNLHLHLHLVYHEFPLSLPVIPQEKYPSTKLLRIINRYISLRPYTSHRVFPVPCSIFKTNVLEWRCLTVCIPKYLLLYWGRFLRSWTKTIFPELLKNTIVVDVIMTYAYLYNILSRTTAVFLIYPGVFDGTSLIWLKSVKSRYITVF